ncbi:MAG TPA: efflux RND transporter periplasmic adaptor subunit [Bryobacteraceae bacterium]|nr:efflux RND transporter periplasmic adaptor subunit [Bryobacteraceae bacterium]
MRSSMKGRCCMAVALSAAFSTYSCSASKPAPAPEAQTAAQAGEATLFQVPPDQMAHLKIVEVRKAVWSSTVHTTGTVDWDADHTTQAITQVSGPISRLLVDLGTPVAVNQPLLYVSSPDVANAISTYRKARNHLDYAKRALDRNQDLLDHKVIAQKDFETAQQDYNDAGSDVENSLQALRIFGVTQQEVDDAQRQGVAINPQLAVRSPIAGVVVQKLVSPGLVIQAGMTACFTISDVSTVWVQGHIYDRDLESIRVGDAVEETNSSSKQTFRGTVSYIGAMVDPATRTTSVRIVTRNPEGMLKKDMFVDAVIHTRSGRSVLSIPTSAILRNDENLPFVYVQAAPGQFAQRLVNLGAQQGDETEITSGAKEGEKIVAEGSLFLQFANSTR